MCCICDEKNDGKEKKNVRGILKLKDHAPFITKLRHNNEANPLEEHKHKDLFSFTTE